MSDASRTAIPFFDCNMRVGRAGVVLPSHILDVPGLLAEMDYCGIQRALVYHVWSREWDAPSGNKELLEELEGIERLNPCFVPLPHATEEMAPPGEFAAMVRGLRGAVRLYPKEHQYVLTDWCMGPTLAALAEAGVPVLVEMSQISWNELAHILETYPALPMILLSISYRADRYVFPLLEKHSNLYIETATFEVMRGIEEVTRKYGPERLIFGTGLPLLDAGGPIAQVVYAEISDEDKRRIAGGTLAKLLGQPWPAEGSAS